MNYIQTLRNILDALMTISVRGNDAITMSNCMQALQQVIEVVENPAPAPTPDMDVAEISE